MKGLGIFILILGLFCTLYGFINGILFTGYFGIVLIICGLVLLFIPSKKKQEIIRLNQNRIPVRYIEGIPNLIRDTACYMKLEEHTGSLVIMSMEFGQIIRLPLRKIANIGITSESELIQLRQRSVVGRSIVGGLLFGNLGAIVGGMSGLKSKNIRCIRNYLIINYYNQENNIEVMSFELRVSSTDKRLTRIVNTVKLLIPTNDIVL